MQLLAQGWGAEKAKQRHLRCAKPLVAQGVQWHALASSEDDQDQDQVQQLVRKHVRGIAAEWTIESHAGAVVARDAKQGIIGAVVVGAADFAGQVVALLQHLVVDPTWRGHGLGVVTLGMAHQLFDGMQKPTMYAGSCARPDARFYQRAGFTVLQPGEHLVFRGNPFPVQNSNQYYPCWFYRTW